MHQRQQTTMRVLILVFVAAVIQVCTSDSTSCYDRCGIYNDTMPCQCNDDCKLYSDCCYDYPLVCVAEDEMTVFVTELWNADVNRIDGLDLEYDAQDQLANYSLRIDEARFDLFTHVASHRLEEGTWPYYTALLDNYERNTGVAERGLGQEKQEVDAFMDAIFATTVMELTTSHVIQHGHFANLEEFKTYFRTLWFARYSRSGTVLDSSGFEHVFVGEVEDGEVSGFTNWCTIHLDEQAKTLNYYGWVKSNVLDQLLIQFTLDEGEGVYYRELSGIQIGVSPEFELAVYTVCYLDHVNHLCPFILNENLSTVDTMDFERSNGTLLGTAYFYV